MSNKEIKIKIAIDTDSKEVVVLKDEVKKLGNVFNDTDSSTSKLLKRIDLFSGAYLVFQTLKNSIGQVVSVGFEANKSFQNLTNSLTMLNAATMSNTLKTGENLSVKDKYNLANIDASRTLDLLRKATLNTSLSLEQNTRLYNAMYLSMGKAGASTKQMVQVVEKLAIATDGMDFNSVIAGIDGLADGTVLANSDFGRFLKGIGLTNEELKNSSDVVSLVLEKLSGFESLESYSSKINKLNSAFTDISSNIMRIPFNYLESKIPATTELFNSLAKSINEINIYFTDAKNLSTYDELVNKQYQLLGRISEVKNDKFTWDSTKKAKLKELNDELEIVFSKLTKIKEQDEKLANKQNLIDLSSYQKMIDETLDPKSAKVDEINQKYEKAQKAFKEAKKDETELLKAWHKELEVLNENENSSKNTLEDYKKALKEVQEVGLSPYEKAIQDINSKTNEWLKAGVNQNEVLKAQSYLLDELTKKQDFESKKDNLNYLEKKAQLIDDLHRREQELANINYQKQNLEINNLDKPLSEKSKLLELETALYNKKLENISLDKNLKELEDTSNSYQSLLDSQISLIEATASWSNNLNGVNSSVNNILSATANLGKLNLTNLKAEDKLRTKYEQDKLKAGNNATKLKQLELQYTKDKSILEQKNISANLIGYSNLAGAMSSMFKEGSREAALFQSAQTALALVEGTRAVLTAGTGDPYTAIPRMLAMGVMVSTLLSQIGVAFGISGGETHQYDSFTLLKANDGSGTVLGDNKARSESIKQSLSILEDYAKPQFLVLADMNRSIKSIDAKIAGVAKIFFQNEHFALGGGYTGYDTGYKNKISSTQQKLGSLAFNVGAGALAPVASVKLLGTMFGGVGSALGGGVVNSLTGLGLSTVASGILASTGIGLVTAIADKVLLGGFVSKTIGKVLGGIFGRKKVTQSLHDSGVYFAPQDLDEALENFKGKSYQTIQTITKKKSWFKSSTSTSYNTYFQELSDETNRQFGLVINNLYDTVVSSGKALDTAYWEIKNNLNGFKVDLGKISLKGKNAKEVQQIFSNVLSKLGDELAEKSFPALERFQNIGEGMFETLTRVSKGMVEAEYYIKRLGAGFEDLKYTQIVNSQGDIAFEALYQSIEKAEKKAYPFSKNLLLVLRTLEGGASELYDTYLTLDGLRDRMLFLKHNINGLSSSMIIGAGDLNSLSDGFQSYFNDFLDEQERLDFSTKSLTKAFKSLNLQLPTSKEHFKTILSNINLSTKAGQELYGRVITLSSAYAKLQEQKEQLLEVEKRKNEELKKSSFDTFLKAIDKLMGTITSLKDTALGFINSFLIKDNKVENIVTYNKLRAEFESYFNSNGTLKDKADNDKVKSIYSNLANISKTLSQNDIFLKDQLIKVFENDILNFDFANDVLKVKIVDGMQEYLNFSVNQTNQIKDMFKTGFITLAGLSSLGLNEEQKKGFLSFINGSNFLKLESANYDKKFSLNSYDVGSVDIPFDQIAKVHKNEMIIPKKFSDSIRAGELSLGDNSKILAELKNLIEVSIQGFNEIRRFRKENDYNLSILKGVN